ncbi:uncharacterized protein LOC107364687 [Tetranychus urticae]|uniref:Chitinase n=1 Tax=Tetranychus urticae TaxID=32264 RepID=T1JQK0_TETUR|nr:uncharacterized protein LOC107364687 [Tetranychus urticae]
MKLIILCFLFLSFKQTIGDFVCPPEATDNFLPDPNNCEVFYRCSHGQKFSFTCGPGTVFNPSTNNCDWPSSVGCNPESGRYKNQQPGYQQPNPPQPNYPYDNDYYNQNRQVVPERNVKPVSNQNNPWDTGAYRGSDVGVNGGSSSQKGQRESTGNYDVGPSSSSESKTEIWNPGYPSSGRQGVRNEVRPEEQNQPYGTTSRPRNPGFDSNRGNEDQQQGNQKKLVNERPNPWEERNSANRNPDNRQGVRGNQNKPYNPQPNARYDDDNDDKLDERSFRVRGKPNTENEPKSIESDGKHPWKVPTPRKDSSVDWNEMTSKSPLDSENVNKVYDDPYSPTSPSSANIETWQKPVAGRNHPTVDKPYQTQDPFNGPKSQGYNPYSRDQTNSRNRYQNPSQGEATSSLPDSPIVYRPSPNSRNQDRDNRVNTPRPDDRRNKVQEKESWEPERVPSFSKNIEPSPDLARDPNERKQGKPQQGTNEPREQNRWVNPKSRQDQNPNERFDNQRLTPAQKYNKDTNKDADDLNQSQQSKRTKPDDRWNKNEPPYRREEDVWNQRNRNPYNSQDRDGSAYGSPERNTDSNRDDPATQTQWYRPKLTTTTTEAPQYETPLRSYDNRWRDPNASTSPYADKRPEARSNPNPRPVYRPDRRQGELRPVPSNQRQNQGGQRLPPSKTNNDRLNQDNYQNRQNPIKEDPRDVQQKEDDFQTFQSSNIEPRFPDESEVAQVMNDMYVNDPYSMPDLMTNLPCNETTLPDCDKCQKLRWLKLNQVTLKSQPDEAIKTLPEYIATDCFRRCHSQGCVAYTYNKGKGHCKLYYGAVHESNIGSDSDYITVIKEPTSVLIADQWLYTDNSEPVGKDMGQFTSDDSISCLRACVNVGDHCKAVSYNSASQLCKIYDSMNGEHLTLTGGGIITLQHKSIHNKDDSWRFSSLGAKKFNTSIPITSFAIREDQECYEECLNVQGCLAIAIEGRSPKECHVYNNLDSLSSDESSSFNTYLVKIPTNSSYFIKLPGIYFSGKPIAKYDNFALKDCQEVVKSLPNAMKVTYLQESQVCYVFSDAAKIGSWKNPEIEAISFLVNLPSDPKYFAYKRLTGLTLTNALLAPKGEKLIGTQSAAQCLDSCLKTDNCSAVSVTYSDVQDSIECILLKDDELTGKPRFVFKEDTDLFVRTLPTNLVPELGEKDDHCSLRINAPSANDNLPYFEKEKSKKQTEPNLLEKAEHYLQKANPFHNKKSSQLNQRDEEENNHGVLIPHGPEFEGMIENLEEEGEEQGYRKERSKRSIYAMTLRGAEVYDAAIDQNSDKNPLEAGAEAGFAVRELLSGALGISDTNATENILLSRFLKRAQDVSQNPRLEEDIVSQIKSSARKVRSHDDKSDDDWKPCKITKGSTVKEIKCRPDEICTHTPVIIHGEEKALTNCSGTRVNSTCTVVCKSGYKAVKDKLVCEALGSNPTWNTKDVSCVADDSMCSELPWIPFTTIKPGSGEKKLNYIVKYDMNKKLPLFGVYKFTVNDKQETSKFGRLQETDDDSVVSLPCSQLKQNQLSNMNYKQSNYTRGYLVPPSAFIHDSDARRLTNYYVNTAPQEPYISQGPWHSLSNTIHAYLETSKQPGFIINGVCSQQIYSPATSALPVPKCFWKTVCTRTQSGQVTAATFYHDNQLISGDESSKKKSLEEIFSYTNPEFVKTLVGNKEYDSLWPEILDRFSTSSSKTVNDEMMILQCAGSTKIDPKHIDFWNSLLSNGTDVSGNDVQNDLATSESQASPTWSQKLTESSKTSPNGCDKKLIAYIGLNEDEINEKTIGPSVTHLTILGAVKINENGSLSFGNDTKKIHDRLYALKSLKSTNPSLKIMIALGGWDNSQYFSKISRSPSHQKIFIMDILAFLDYWEFDGVDIIWQYPNIGGKVKGSGEDKDNLNRLMQNLKDSMVDHQSRNGRSLPYSLVLTGPGLYWILDYGYDLKTLINHVDWINIMAFDFHGPWNSSWGDYTGPMAPLYFGAPEGFPGKLNIDAIVKRYICETGRPDKLVLGVGFFGRAWTNVGNHVDESKDDLFRKASPLKNGSKGSMVSYRKIRQEWLSKGEPIWHNKTQTSFIWNRMKRSLISFESEDSIKGKVSFAESKGLGGLMIWSLDMDDEDKTLLKAIGNGLKCRSDKNSISHSYKCNPLTEKRHWTQYDDDGSKDRLCGKRAPLINGHYPICDPDDPGYSCCSASGYCGSGPQFCECEGCVDYSLNPDRALNDSIAPSSPSVTWLTTDVIQDASKSDCGFNAQSLVNGSRPTCNPDDPQRHCCSSTGFCGTGPDYCECKGCINFNTNSTNSFPEKNWFDWNDGPENAGRCGPRAPRIKGRLAGCDPSSETANCCGPNGYCGTGPDYCKCKECVNFTLKPNFDWS